MKKTTKEKLKLGVFVIVGLLLFIVAVYLIGKRQNMFTKTFSISANFNNINGLMLGNNVRYSGIKVGIVKSIEMINDSVIKVSMNIEEKMVQHIKKDAIATIGTDGLVGNMIVNIIPGEGNSEKITSGDVIASYSKIGTADMLNTLSVTNENAALLTSKLLDIVNSITNGKGTLGMLINDSIMATNLKQTVQQLKFTSMEASKTMMDINGVISTVNFNNSVAGVLLNDSLEAKKVKAIITNLETTSKEMKGVILNINETFKQIKEGDGALHYLSNNKEFVTELEQTIKNINEGTAKFNENMEALKHNFLTRGYFKKLERQQKKEIKKLK